MESNKLFTKIDRFIAELRSLLKQIEKEYPSSVNSPDIKQLDNYYLALKKNIDSLYQLIEDLRTEEKKPGEKESSKGEVYIEASKTFEKISILVKMLKESFYMASEEALGA